MEISISFQDIWNYIKRRFWRLVVIVVLIAIAGGIVSAFAIPRTYTSASVVVISADVAESADPDYRNQYTGIISNRVSVGLAMVNGTEGEQMREEVASYLGIDPEHILTINATQMQGGPNIQIKTTTDLPELNAQISDAACEVLAQKLTEMLPSPPLKIEMIDHGQKASVSSTFGALAKGGVLCGALAVVVCFLFCVLRVLSGHRVRNSVELSSAAALPLFGEISASQKADHTEEMRRIRAALLQKAGGAKLLAARPRRRRCAGRLYGESRALDCRLRQEGLACEHEPCVKGAGLPFGSRCFPYAVGGPFGQCRLRRGRLEDAGPHAVVFGRRGNGPRVRRRAACLPGHGVAFAAGASRL